MAAVQRKLEKLSNADVSVLIQGENGTGKEVLARFIHQHSPCKQGPFINVTCPAIPASLLESELFGYQKGSFTGAHADKKGRVELAHGGTLFMDEIAELESPLQAKLLQFLQDGQFSRIGAKSNSLVKTRMICATHRNLEDEIGKGSFRQDLFYRINVVSVQLPPLRERVDDIPMLCEYFLDGHTERFGTVRRHLTPRALTLLQRHSWPGNIRELENLIKRFVILGSDEAIAEALVGHNLGRPVLDEDGDGSMSLKSMTRRAVRELEHKLILQTLQTHNWNRKHSARVLGISYRALLYKLKEAGVSPADGEHA